LNICKICAKESWEKEYQIKEMMFGLREFFTYFRCESCGCLQILKAPKDMDIYYRQKDYYSFKTSHKKIDLKLVKKIIVWIKINKNINFLSRLFSIVSSKFNNYLKWLKFVKDISFESKILDVGCGSGELLTELKELGFNNLYGVDLYIDSTKNEAGINILRGSLEDVNGEYDLIMLHHSLEHMLDQGKVMHKLSQLLSSNGSLIIRIPLVDCYAWRMYGENWYQIDAPRHFYLHSYESIMLLAKMNNFYLIDAYRDSTELQFSISEMYAKNIASNEIDATSLNKISKALRNKAAFLNSQNEGDQGCFIFKKLTDYSIDKSYK